MLKSIQAVKYRSIRVQTLDWLFRFALLANYVAAAIQINALKLHPLNPLQISLAFDLPLNYDLQLSVRDYHLQQLIDINSQIPVFSEIKETIVRMLLATELTLYAFYRHVVLYVKIVILVPFRVLTRENKVMLLFQ